MAWQDRDDLDDGEDVRDDLAAAIAQGSLGKQWEKLDVWQKEVEEKNEKLKLSREFHGLQWIWGKWELPANAPPQAPLLRPLACLAFRSCQNFPDYMLLRRGCPWFPGCDRSASCPLTTGEQCRHAASP